MMLETIFRLLSQQPLRLAEHVEAYAELATIEAQGVGRSMRRRWCLRLVATALATSGLLLGAIAALLFAVLPLEQMPHPWLLCFLPSLPLLLALGCWLSAPKENLSSHFAGLRAQLSADAAMLRELARSEKEFGL